MTLQPSEQEPREHPLAPTALKELYGRWVSWASVGHRQPVLLLLVCGAFGGYAALTRGLETLNTYDEGLLFTDAFLMNRGREIYRDFYVNYPPGILQFVRLLSLLDSPIWSSRLFALFVRIGSALLAGWLAGRARQEKLCLATVSVVLLVQSDMQLVVSAYTLGVFAVLAGTVIWSRPGVTLWRSVSSGVLLGVISYVRHDLLLGAVALFAMVETLWWLVHRRLLLFDSPRQLGLIAASATATALVLWTPHLIASGFSRIVHDIVLDQARLTMPARRLPLPRFGGFVDASLLGIPIPTALSNHLRVALLIAAVATFATLLLLPLRLLSAPVIDRSSRITLLLCGFALATLPQALQRIDIVHVGYGVPLMVPVLFALLGRRFTLPVLLLVLVPWLVVPPTLANRAMLQQLWKQRGDSVYFAAGRQQLAAFIARETLPDEPIFVGCPSHRRLVVNPVDVYYVVRRAGATRYMQFDPGTVTGEPGQLEMIADLERTKPRIVLRAPRCFWQEPNASQIQGSGLLDAYLEQKYAPERILGGFLVSRRR